MDWLSIIFKEVNFPYKYMKPPYFKLKLSYILLAYIVIKDTESKNIAPPLRLVLFKISEFYSMKFLEF